MGLFEICNTLGTNNKEKPLMPNGATARTISPSPKSYTVAVALSAIFGVMGVHHIYLQRWAEFLIDFSLFCLTIYFYIQGEWVYAVLFGVADALHTFVITIMLLTGSFKDGNGHTVCYPGQGIN
jgi:TM2 domain-containing membrane protein YozV